MERRPATWWNVSAAEDATRREDPGRMLVSAVVLSAVVWLLLAALVAAVLLR